VQHDELTEFQALSRKVSDKTADDAERARWRELRDQLRAAAMPLANAHDSRPHAHDSQPHAQRRTRKLKVEYAAVEELHATFTEQLSASGLELRLSAHVKPDTTMLVRLELGAPGPIVVTARVAWCRRDGGHFVAGLELVGVRDDERERIEAWLVSASDRALDPTVARS
jgi:hypothetical protein